MNLKRGLYGYIGHGETHEGFIAAVYLSVMPNRNMYEAVLETILDRLDTRFVNWRSYLSIGVSMHGIRAY